ncbi:hypothetical protein FCH28_06165 [Streptomyces piniterrae]|uniref:Terpene synthase n=1 Tax=Streptomyces piniterrae TaxID=2571125 RepID=A0A4U0NR36_9ACTN|nr:hypothetical protein [Streptomyces piniterrae]TJZ57051.1 hypothetical protein FCH28_06165 [Streptomyces piniterrae]
MADAAYTIPPLWCPIEPAINPAWRAADRGTAEFARRFGLPRDPQLVKVKPEKLRIGELAGRFAPAADLKGLQLLSDVAYWTFIIDDDTDPSPQSNDAQPKAPDLADLCGFLSRIQRAFDTPAAMPLPDGPESGSGHLAAARDLRRRMEERTSDQQVGRWAASVRITFFVCLHEAAYQKRGRFPSLDEYFVRGIGSSLLQIFTNVMAVIDGPTVAPDDLERPEVRALTELTCLIARIDNDLYSYGRDLDGDIESSLVATLAREVGSFDAGLAQTVGTHDLLVGRFLKLRDRVLTTARPELRAYLLNLTALIRGHLDWASDLMRNRSDFSYFQRKTRVRWPVVFADAPSGHPHPPLTALPSVAWWWEV